MRSHLDGDVNSSSDDEQRQNRSLDNIAVERRNKENLPKLVVKKFYGDPIYWPEYIDTFKIAIHENTDFHIGSRLLYMRIRISI